MLQSRRGFERLRSYLVLAATAGTITFNWMAANGRVNGVTPDVISAMYPTAVTPAGYAFAIWSLIYLGLMVFSIYQLLPANLDRFSRIRSQYILSGALNCAWIYFWHSNQIAICLVIIVALVVNLFLINRALTETRSIREYWAARAPLELYFGWVTAAALINFAVFLKYVGVSMSDTSSAFFGSALILTATGLAVLMRSVYRSYIYPLAVAWALTAIAVRQSGHTLVVTAAAIGVIACLIASVSCVMNLNSSRNEHR